MENITNEQREFDNIIHQINEDFESHPNLFIRSNSPSRILIEFANNSDATILISNNSRMITFFGHSDGDYRIIDADYVESSQDFYHQIETFEEFYQGRKEETKRQLTSLGINIAPEVNQPTSLKQDVFSDVSKEAEPYSQAWLKNSNNAMWELHWSNGFDENSEHYISQDLFQIKDGEFVVHERRAIDNREVLQRNLSVEKVKSFVFDRVTDYENTLARIGIEVDQVDLSTEPSMPLSPQEQLLSRIENEYTSFKDGVKQNSKEKMMSENLYEAMVKGEIVHHVREGYINDDVARTLLKSEIILDDIYQQYTAKNSNEFFELIQTAINDHITQYQGLSEEIKPTFKTPQVFDKTTITPTAFINPTVCEGFRNMQYEFEIDNDLREIWEAFGEEINTDVYRIQYDDVKLETIIVETSSASFDVSEDKTHLFNVGDVLAHCEALAEAGELDDYTPEFISYLETLDHEEVEQNQQYVEVQEAAENMFQSVEELDADGIRNMKKHKERTNIKIFENQVLELY